MASSIEVKAIVAVAEHEVLMGVELVRCQEHPESFINWSVVANYSDLLVEWAVGLALSIRRLSSVMKTYPRKCSACPAAISE